MLKPDGDALSRFTFEHAAVRGSCVTLAATSRALIACHPYPPAVARVIAELAAAAALLASALKFDGRLVLQLSGDGPLRLLVVECAPGLALRATAQWDASRVAALGDDANLASLAGDPARGRLLIALDRPDAVPYQGIVALQPGSVADLVAHYLATSEQIDSRIALAYADGCVAGTLLQRMPEAGPDDMATWTRVSAGDDAPAAAALLAGEPVTTVLAQRFPDDDLRVLAPATPHFQCHCSEERVVRALRVAGRDEIEAAIAERGDVEVCCEFCNRRYTFTPAVARALFDDPGDDARH
jgi:molecular chaperone Hsp33